MWVVGVIISFQANIELAVSSRGFDASVQGLDFGMFIVLSLGLIGLRI